MPQNKKQNSFATNDDGLDGMEATLKAIQKRARARYDGVLGTLPDWVPRNFHDDFKGARGRLLDEGYEPEVLQALVTERMQSSRAVDTRPFIPSPIPKDIKTFFRDINTLAHIKTAVDMEKLKGLAFLTDSAHAAKVAKGDQFSSGGASKKGKEGQLKKGIKRICSVIQSTRFKEVLSVIRNEDDRWDALLHSRNEPIVEFFSVNDEDEVIHYLNLGEPEGHEKKISFKRLANILTEIKMN